MLTTILALALAIWPFTPTARPGHRHSRAAHARHLQHLQQQRARHLAKCHGAAHPSLIRVR